MHQFAHIFLNFSFYPFTCSPIHLPAYLSFHSSIHSCTRFACLSLNYGLFRLLIYLTRHLFDHISDHFFIYMQISLAFYWSVYPFLLSLIRSSEVMSSRPLVRHFIRASICISCSLIRAFNCLSRRPPVPLHPSTILYHFAFSPLSLHTFMYSMVCCLSIRPSILQSI